MHGGSHSSRTMIHTRCISNLKLVIILGQWDNVVRVHDCVEYLSSVILCSTIHDAPSSHLSTPHTVFNPPALLIHQSPPNHISIHISPPHLPLNLLKPPHAPNIPCHNIQRHPRISSSTTALRAPLMTLAEQMPLAEHIPPNLLIRRHRCRRQSLTVFLTC